MLPSVNAAAVCTFIHQPPIIIAFTFTIISPIVFIFSYSKDQPLIIIAFIVPPIVFIFPIMVGIAIIRMIIIAMWMIIKLLQGSTRYYHCLHLPHCLHYRLHHLVHHLVHHEDVMRLILIWWHTRLSLLAPELPPCQINNFDIIIILSIVPFVIIIIIKTQNSSDSHQPACPP